jgi:hypothetical protein
VRKSGFRSWALTSLMAVLVLGATSGFRVGDDEKLTVDQLIEKHLASIASPDRLMERHSFALKGQVIFRITIGGSGGSGGTAQIVSKGKADNILLSSIRPRTRGNTSSPTARKRVPSTALRASGTRWPRSFKASVVF